MPASFRSGFKLLLAVALLVQPPGPARSAESPQRIVSINLCADVLLLELADREQIASLTWLAATSPLSPVRQKAQGLPFNKGQLEEVLALQPDLVVTHRYGNAPLARRLEQLGLPVYILNPPTDIPAVLTEIQTLGKRLGKPDRADTLIERYRQAFAREASTPTRPVLAVYGPNGITSGPGSLLHDVLTRAGFDNLAAQLDIGSVGTLRMEALLTSDPDALLFSDSGGEINSLARQKLQHPALQRLAESKPAIRLPGRLWTCGGPEVLQAFAELRELRSEVGNLAP